MPCGEVKKKKKERERLQRVNKLTKILINKLKKTEESNIYQERRHDAVSLSPCFSLCLFGLAVPELCPLIINSNIC